MKRFLVLFVIMMTIGSGGCSAEPCQENLILEATAIQAIKRYQGCEATVRGVVLNTYVFEDKQIIFLNLGHSNYQEAFSVVIFASSLERFRAMGIINPEEHYYYEAIAVTGILKEYEGRPQIIVSSPEQIVIE